MDDEAPFTLDDAGLHAFCATKGHTFWFLNSATDDYAAARHSLNAGLMAGFHLAALAVEKYLKGFVMLAGGNAQARHDTRKLIEAATNAGLRLSPEHRQTVDRLARHYVARYPDVDDAHFSRTTAELDAIDDLVATINEQLPCPPEVALRSGLFAAITFHVDHAGHLSPTEAAVMHGNGRLAPLQARAVARFLEWCRFTGAELAPHEP